MTKGEINYKNGKIYKIEPICEHDEGEIYIGSTTKQYLSQRMTAHRNGYKRFKEGKTKKVMSYNLFDKYGIDKCDIILLELVEANSKDELHTREAHYIKTISCINKCIPMRTKPEYRQDNKEKIIETKKQFYQENKQKINQYRQDNRKKISEQRKQYRRDNEETLKQYRHDNKEKMKQYYLDSKEKIREQRKQYYQDNKEKILEREKQYRQNKKLDNMSS